MSQLELYESVPRCELRRLVNKCLTGMEKVSLRETCNKMLLPLLRRSADTVDHDSAMKCLKVSEIFSARLDQVMEEISKMDPAI